MLEVAGLDAHHGRAQVLFGVSFAMAAGEVLVLLGRNGAGKSTTIKALMGLVRPSAGRIRLDGAEMAGWEPYRIARAGLGYVPEERRIFADLTVLENLEVGRRAGPASNVAAWDVERVFALFPALAAMRHRPGGQMSGGEQQMLAIGRTLMGNPRLLLLDEPSEGLAPVIVQQMAAAVQGLKADGVTILLAEQNLRFAAPVGDRAIVLERGTVAWSGPMDAVATDPAARRALLV